MPYFTHRFETTIALHPVGTYHYTVVYLDESVQSTLPLAQHPRLRVEADISGLGFKGAWQPAKGRWYLMLPKAPLRKAHLGVGSPVEVAFRVIDQDDVEVPAELAAALKEHSDCRGAWESLSAGKQRGLAHMVASARTPVTREARLERVLLALRGETPMPWERSAASKAATTKRR